MLRNSFQEYQDAGQHDRETAPKNFENYDSRGGIDSSAVAAGLRGILEAGSIIDSTAEDPEERRKRIEAQENASNLGAVIGLGVRILSAAVDTVNENHLYTPRAFSGGTNARAILEYSMSDKASADRAAVKEAMAQGQSFEEASAQFLSDECFEAWYQDTLASLEAFQG